MTFPYGSVWRDRIDGETISVICQSEDEMWWHVVILVASGSSASYPPAGNIAARDVDMPQWERVE